MRPVFDPYVDIAAMVCPGRQENVVVDSEATSMAAALLDTTASLEVLN
jgi:hypothetical protein